MRSSFRSHFSLLAFGGAHVWGIVSPWNISGGNLVAVSLDIDLEYAIALRPGFCGECNASFRRFYKVFWRPVLESYRHFIKQLVLGYRLIDLAELMKACLVFAYFILRKVELD